MSKRLIHTDGAEQSAMEQRLPMDRRRLGMLLASAGPVVLSERLARGVHIQITALAEQLDAILRRPVERDEFAGAALIVRGGETLLRAGYGLANRDTGEP